MTTVVVGAGSGIGKALVAVFAGEGPAIGISHRTGLPARWLHSDYSETSLCDVAGQLRERCLDGIDRLVICNGLLHDEQGTPEKRLDRVTPDWLRASFERNVIVPTMALKSILPLVAKNRRAVAAVLSARVGSIEDNRLGGWYAYRASKAALNQVVRTTAIEMARTHRQLAVIALHPGTTHTALSHPFVGHKPDAAVDVTTTATRLAGVIENLDADQSGHFMDWSGDTLPW